MAMQYGFRTSYFSGYPGRMFHYSSMHAKTYGNIASQLLRGELIIYYYKAKASLGKLGVLAQMHSRFFTRRLKR